MTSSSRAGDRAGRAALGVALAALALSVTGIADAARERLFPPIVKKPRAGALLTLGADGRFPARALPAKVPAARTADRVGDSTEKQLKEGCPARAVDLGSWCIDADVQPLGPEEAGRNDYSFAARRCAASGGWLPSAAQLVGAAARVRLSATIDDDPLKGSVDEDPSDGRKDRREMSATLVTTRAGSSAAGSQGVTEGSTGDPRQGEPNPTPQPADPAPESLQYVTVYDNGDRGGFAGSRPVAEPERFRCAYAKAQAVADAGAE